MTIQSLYTLSLLRAVQRRESYKVKVYSMPALLETHGCSMDQRISRKIEKTSGIIQSSLPYLKEEGLLCMDEGENDGSFSDVVHLTHRGFHYGQIVLSNFLKFLGKSVAVPIAASFITALATSLFKNKVLLWLSQL